MIKKINFEEITLRLAVSSRGGGIEIDLTSLGFKDEKMTAYQNYLGGGILGSIGSDNTIRHKDEKLSADKQRLLERIERNLKEYFHHLTNPDSEFEAMEFVDRQKLPLRAY